MTDMREQARDILNAHCEYMGGMDAGQAFIRTENALKAVEAALSLMQPEIDRRVNAAIATMFERLRTPSEGMCRAGYFAEDLYPKHQCDNQKELHHCVSEPRWQAMLDAFQQENSDAD